MIGPIASAILILASLSTERVEWGGIVELDGKIVGLYSYGHHEYGKDSGILRARAYLDYVDGTGAIRMQHTTFMESAEGGIQEITLNLRNGDEKIDGWWKIEGEKRIQQGVEKVEPWDPETIGFHGVHRLQEEKGLSEGTTYSAKVFHAGIGAASWTWTVAGKETVKEIPCTRIDGRCESMPDLTFSRWVDDAFQTWKESVPAGGAMVTVTRIAMDKVDTWQGLLEDGGTLEGRRYQHPALGLSLEWPEGWKAEFTRRPSPVLTLRSGESVISVITAAPGAIGVDEMLEHTKGKYGDYEAKEISVDGVKGKDARYGEKARLAVIPSEKGLFLILLENPTAEHHAALDTLLESVDILG